MEHRETFIPHLRWCFWAYALPIAFKSGWPALLRSSFTLSLTIGFYTRLVLQAMGALIHHHCLLSLCWANRKPTYKAYSQRTLKLGMTCSSYTRNWTQGLQLRSTWRPERHMRALGTRTSCTLACFLFHMWLYSANRKQVLYALSVWRYT